MVVAGLMPTGHAPTVAASLAQFLALYVFLFAAFGALSPFQPALFSARGLRPELIGLMLAAGTAVRLITGPIAGRLADRFAVPRGVLAAFTLAAAVAALAYLSVRHPWSLLIVSILQAMALAPIVPIADALTLASAVPALRSGGFDYGWVRGAGSAAFIIGVIVGGRTIAHFGFAATILLNAALLAVASVIAAWVPDRLASHAAAWRHAPREHANHDGLRALLRLAPFRRVLLVAALIQGSHAMHDSFAVIRWQAAGINAGTIGLLWSEGVAAEIVVFLVAGRLVLNRVGPAAAAMLAALAGVVRWGVMAQITAIAPIALVEPLHGLTFALLHLACMRLISETVPSALAATAQTAYATLAIGATTALLTLCSGPLYARFGAGGFWVMSGLCGVALPLARGLRSAAEQATNG